MRPATGLLKTGTYISELVAAPGKYTTVKDDRSKLTLTDESQNAVKWFIDPLGNDVYRVTVKNFDITVTPDFAVDIGKGSTEWIIKETSVPGEYSSGPAERPDFYACIEERGEAHVGVKLSSEMTKAKVHFFGVDE